MSETLVSEEVAKMVERLLRLSGDQDYANSRADWLMREAAALLQATAELASRQGEDAERYRWLREANDQDWNALLRDGGESLDAAIDAARALVEGATQSDKG